MSMQVSQRGAAMPASPIRKLAPLAEEARDRGVKIYSLNIGQPDLPSPPQAFAALKDYEGHILDYSPSQGLLSLRQKISEYYTRFNISLSPDEIMVTCGGSEALLFAFLACCDPGDEILVTEPVYANYIGLGRMTGVKVVGIPSSIRDDFALPPVEVFEQHVGPCTKAILVCNPNNPTGAMFKPDEMMRLRDMVERHNLWLIADEVYREFCYTGQPFLSAMHLDGIADRVVLIDSMSKRYSECGIRIGCLCSHNAQMMATVLKFGQARLSPPLLGQVVAQASIDCSADYLRENLEEYVRRRKVLVEGLNSIPGVYSPMPMGAFYTTAELPVDDAERFCRWCLSEFEWEGHTVFLAPAAGFYTHPELGRRQVRVAYVIGCDELRHAIEVLRHALEAYPGRTQA